MTGTVRDQIDDAIEAALTDLVDAGALEFDPLGDPIIFPGLAVYNHGDRLLEEDAVSERRAMDLSIEGYVDGAGTREGTRARNDLHARTVAAIMRHEQLDGLVELVEPGEVRRTTLRFDVGGRLTFSADFTIQFTTSRADPALPA